MAELGHWGRGEPVGISPRSAQRVRQTIRLWLVHRAKPVQVADPGLPPKKDKKKGQQEQKEQHKQRVLEEHRLEEDFPPGVQRIWTDGSQQKGADGRQYAGYGVWFGERHALDHCVALPGLLQTNNRAELQACKHALQIAPLHTPLQLCVDS